MLVTSWSDVWDFSSSLFNLEDTGSAEAEKIDGDIAQLGERLPCKQEVSGSNPLVPTNENQTVAEMQLSDFYVCYSRVFQRFSAAGLSRKSNRETTWRQLCAFCAASQKCLQTEQIC